MSPSSSSSSYSTPCAACKFLRRKCMPGCIFAPYFPPEEPQKFVNVHKIFGASNVSKLLNELLPHQREDAVSSLTYEAEARVRDPVYGCVNAISFLQRQVHRLQKELEAANADLIRYASYNGIIQTTSGISLNHQLQGTTSVQPMPPAPPVTVASRRLPVEFAAADPGSTYDGEGGGLFYQSPPYYSLPWDDVSGGGGSLI